MSPLIDSAELAVRLRDSAPPVVVDARWRLGGPSTQADYLAGHIPTAVWADLDADLADPPGVRGRHPLPSPARLERVLRRWGVNDDSPVVVYDDADSTAAARAWWVLRWAGLTDVRVLDGGLAAWQSERRPLETGPCAPRGGSVQVRPGGLPLLDADGAAQVARDGVLLDARSAERFRGEVEPIDAVAGHIPGARSAPTGSNVTPDGRLRTAEDLRRRFAALGVATDVRRVGAYCGSGVTAAHTVLALEVAGIPAALYAGSWSEWINDRSRPIATGP